eukprot:5166344-Pleurochrysis_carterae.AAC.7
MVKDLRTQYETSQPQDVLDGGLDGFIDAFLRQRSAESGADSVTASTIARGVSDISGGWHPNFERSLLHKLCSHEGAFRYLTPFIHAVYIRLGIAVIPVAVSGDICQISTRWQFVVLRLVRCLSIHTTVPSWAVLDIASHCTKH